MTIALIASVYVSVQELELTVVHLDSCYAGLYWPVSVHELELTVVHVDSCYAGA